MGYIFILQGKEEGITTTITIKGGEEAKAFARALLCLGFKAQSSGRAADDRREIVIDRPGGPGDETPVFSW